MKEILFHNVHICLEDSNFIQIGSGHIVTHYIHILIHL